MKLSNFNFELPNKLLAQRPSHGRDESRLMVLNRAEESISHYTFKEVIDFFDEGDVMVLNNTKVFPARLFGNKEKTGARIEVFLLRELSEEQRKSVSFWLLNRYASAVSGNRDAQELAVVMTNEIYNKNWNELGVKHPQLQWQLLCATHNAASSIRRHNWIGFKKKTGDNSKSVKLLEQLYPNMKRDEVELLARIHTKKELKELAKEHDIDIKL